MARGQVERRVGFGWTLGAITLLAVGLRLWVAATEPPHFDESYTALHYVLAGPRPLLTTYDEPNNHVFHSLLAWISTSALGDGPLALRLPALLAGIALVPAVGLVARAVASREAADPSAAAVSGLVAATIVAAAPPLIAYSANARGYSIVLLLLTAQLALTLRLGARQIPPSRPGRVVATWAAWVACGALAIWTVPTALLGVGVASLWLAALRGSSLRGLGPLLIGPVATALLSLLLYAPVLGDAGFSVDRFAAAPLRDLAMTTVHAWTAGRAAPLIGVAVLLAVAGAARRPQLGPAAPLTLGLLAVPIAIALLGRIPPYSRTYLFLLIAVAVLAGLGAARLTPVLGARPVAAALCAAGFAGLSLLAATGAQTRDAWAEDPPGPSQRDLVAAIDAAHAAHPTAAPPDGRLIAPRFDLPQVQYAATQGAVAGDMPLTREQALGAFAPGAPGAGGAGGVMLLTRASVDPLVALTAAGLDPAAFGLVSRTLRGDAQVIVARAR